MDDPLAAARAVDEWVDSVAAKSPDPEAVLRYVGAELVAKWGVERGGSGSSSGLAVSARPGKVLSLQLVAPEDLAALPAPLRAPVGRVLTALSEAESARRLALAQLPPELTVSRVREQLRSGPSAPGDYRLAMKALSVETLVAVGVDLLRAVAQLREALAQLTPLPKVAWQRETPLGTILVDTTGADNIHRLIDPLLVIDVGGNDNYVFVSRGDDNRISLLLDIDGDDTYVVYGEGADSSAGILGIGILWDTSGNDTYRGGHLVQASAGFGVAVLVDEAGGNRFEATGHAQAHAIAGVAVMISGGGADRYSALTAAQGSAGPGGLALLLDRGGNDHYVLTAEPLVSPSAQLPERNASLGQGAGYGIRVGLGDEGSAAGGTGILIDLAGDDRYEGQVFAQGAGFQQGAGLLVDRGGNDRFAAAWYAMGAAAHGGVGMLAKHGVGNDDYRISHVMGIGAAHDFSIAIFRDEGGSESYFVPDLGIGVAHDNSLAVFVDFAGADTYSVADTAPVAGPDPGCRAMGASVLSVSGTRRDRMANVAIFADLAGDDRWPSHCLGQRGTDRWRVGK